MTWQVLTLRQTKYISLLLRSGFFPFATNNRRISFHYVITINTQKTGAARNPLVFSLPPHLVTNPRARRSAQVSRVSHTIFLIITAEPLACKIPFLRSAALKRAQDRGRATAFGTYQGAHSNFRNSDHSAETSLFAAAGRFSGLWLYKHQLANV